MTTINPSFTDELKKYGAGDFKACYNCGTCTAVCDLTQKDANFPRMFLRYGMLGLDKDLLQSKELWLCYACGECGENCPRQAGPDQFMGALRRYAIAQYEPTGLTRMIFKSNPFAIAVTLTLAVILGFFLFTMKPEMEVSRWIFEWMPFDVIHDMGMLIFGFTGLAMIVGVFNMWRNLSRTMEGEKTSNKKIIPAIREVLAELATMKRYQTCDSDEESFWGSKPSWVRPWFVHWSVMWGFLGLLLATILDFMLKDPATTVWWPSRILGTVAGLLMMYGATLALWYRATKVTKSYESSSLADYMFLVFLWIAGITGFWLEVSVMFGSNTLANQLVFVIHTIISMELVILFAFSKFAHALYRPLALFFYFYTKKS